jgi:hypothetical protein
MAHAGKLPPWDRSGEGRQADASTSFLKKEAKNFYFLSIADVFFQVLLLRKITLALRV